MKVVVVSMLTGLLAACASSEVRVRVPSPAPVVASASAQRIKLEVSDLRAPGIAASTRQAAFGVPMGNVVFEPSERQLVSDALLAALARQPQSGGTYTCEILEFSVNTAATPLYWDVVGVVRLKFRQDGHERVLFGTHTERTYLWPGEGIFGEVARESLRKAVETLDSASS